MPFWRALAPSVGRSSVSRPASALVPGSWARDAPSADYVRWRKQAPTLIGPFRQVTDPAFGAVPQIE